MTDKGQMLTAEEAGRKLRELAEMTARYSQNWGNFQSIATDMLRAAMAVHANDRKEVMQPEPESTGDHVAKPARDDDLGRAVAAERHRVFDSLMGCYWGWAQDDNSDGATALGNAIHILFPEFRAEARERIARSHELAQPKPPAGAEKEAG